MRATASRDNKQKEFPSPVSSRRHVQQGIAATKYYYKYKREKKLRMISQPTFPARAPTRLYICYQLRLYTHIYMSIEEKQTKREKNSLLVLGYII